MKSYTIFRVKNGWILQTYAGSVGFAPGKEDNEKTYVFTSASAIAQFLSADHFQ